jgi:hypothetical protein
MGWLVKRFSKFGESSLLNSEGSFVRVGESSQSVNLAAASIAVGDLVR